MKNTRLKSKLNVTNKKPYVCHYNKPEKELICLKQLFLVNLTNMIWDFVCNPTTDIDVLDNHKKYLGKTF